MASKRLLKKDVNYVFGDIIDAAYIHQMANPKEDPAKSEAIVDEAIQEYDKFIAKINRRDIENQKKHFSEINKELQESASALVEKINAL